MPKQFASFNYPQMDTFKPITVTKNIADTFFSNSAIKGKLDSKKTLDKPRNWRCAD